MTLQTIDGIPVSDMFQTTLYSKTERPSKLMSHRFSDDIPRLAARLFFTAALLFSLPSPAAPRVATSDWTVAETLTAMGHPPVSVADRRVYDTWVNHPPLPAAVKEAGLRFQPNLERL